MDFPSIFELSRAEKRILSRDGSHSTVFNLVEFPDIAVKTVSEILFQESEFAVLSRLRELFGFTKIEDYLNTGLIIPFGYSEPYCGKRKEAEAPMTVRDLFMPIMTHGSLRRFYQSFSSTYAEPLNPATCFSKEQLVSLFNQLSRPLQILHENYITHLDVKSDNFLVSTMDGGVWLGLGDFDLSDDHRVDTLMLSYEDIRRVDIQDLAFVFRELLLCNYKGSGNPSLISNIYSRELNDLIHNGGIDFVYTPNELARAVSDLL